MKNDEHGNIILTSEEAGDIADFIDHALYRAWDRYTDNYLCGDVSWEDGKRRMDTQMYDFMQHLRNHLLDECTTCKTPAA